MSRPLRIALLTHSTNPRGGVSHCLSLAEALTALGHEAVVHAPDPARRGFFRAAACATVSVPACRIESRSTADMVEQRVADYWDWFTAPGHRGFDLYHAHDGIGGCALAELHAAGLVPRFVRTVHHLDHFQDPRVEARQERAVVAAGTALCVSDTWVTELRRRYGVAAQRVSNGVDRAAFSPVPGPGDAAVRTRLGLGDGPVLLAVGGLEPRKNSLRVVEAFARLRVRYPRAQLVVAGGASVLDHSAYAGLCREALQRLGLDGRAPGAVVVAGPVPQADMPALYRIADTLAFPSLQEGFGLAVIEAMASGTPAVVSRIAPFTEYLGPADAFWAEPTETGSIAAALEASLEPRARAARAARGQAVAARFDWAASARTHLDRYAAHLAGAPQESVHA
ncbi:MSMEG_0565 family glycosyltransferase [Lichenibacterium ramalinae]|uniref:MSMEG_0565 family glycosyltransferase n=1 Tax=Lichenibacterium ramalinae TaxID=2316527 RepID=A0A4Q2RJX0_9HYPH|nr:MSMEG_0565 family glycosyltransferase [Lichenibacterium ramalinae]RYB07311.1 MSMEG_0565 family glycosyltransferase [Lichenibacterium ramalinae]